MHSKVPNIKHEYLSIAMNFQVYILRCIGLYKLLYDRLQKV